MDYDIFLGIMWARFGTPTPRADSGTEEEFERALGRYQDNPSSMDVMFYFKEGPIDLAVIDTDQLAAVRKFKANLGPQGVLHWQFRTPEELHSLLTIHLGRKAQAWREKLASSPPSPRQTPDRAVAAPPEVLTAEQSIDTEGLLAADLEEIAELGLIELSEMYEDAFTELSKITMRMAEDITNLGDKLRERTAEVEAITPANTRQRVQAAKRILKRAADDLNQYVQRTRVELPPFAATLQRAIDTYGRALTITTEFGPSAVDQVRGALEQVSSLRSSIAGAGDGAGGLKVTIAGWPRMSGDLIAAKKRAVAVLGDIINECQSADRLLAELTDSMNDWLGQAT